MEKKMSLKNAGGFPKAFNPHLKRNKALKKNQEEDEVIKDDFWRTLLLNLRDTIYGIIPNSLEDEIFIFVNMIFLNNNVPSY